MHGLINFISHHPRLTLAFCSTIALCGLIFLLTGCNNELVSTKCAGEIIRISPVSTSWNEQIKTGIETTKGTFIVVGSVSAMKGAKVTIQTYSSRQTFLCIEGRPRCPRVIGF